MIKIKKTTKGRELHEILCFDVSKLSQSVEHTITDDTPVMPSFKIPVSLKVEEEKKSDSDDDSSSSDEDMKVRRKVPAGQDGMS